MELKRGQIIKSKAGRDKDRYFMIYSYDGGDFVYLVDGVLRKLTNPKKKKIKHIMPTSQQLEGIAQKLENSQKVFDAELRRALEATMNTKHASEEG